MLIQDLLQNCRHNEGAQTQKSAQMQKVAILELHIVYERHTTKSLKLGGGIFFYTLNFVLCKQQVGTYLSCICLNYLLWMTLTLCAYPWLLTIIVHNSSSQTFKARKGDHEIEILHCENQDNENEDK